MKIELTDKWENITDEQRSTWNKAYPAINLDQELAKMQSWVLANPKNRKSNWERFIINWLSKAQDKAPTDKIANGLDMIAKAQAMFCETKTRMDETLTVNTTSTEDIKLEILSRYQTPESFIKMMKFSAQSLGVQSKSGVLYEHWARWWRIGCDNWGVSTLKDLWNKKEEMRNISEQIKKAKEIENKV